MKKTSLFDIYIGQSVSITTDVIATDMVMTDNGAETFMYPITYQGIFLDESDDFVFLGPTGDEITDTINKNKIVHIGFIAEKTVYDEILENSPVPSIDEAN